MVVENNTQAIDDEAPIGIGNMDFEFMTADDPEMQPYHMLTKMQQNLTPEELKEMQNLMPSVTRFSLLYYKAETGEFPQEPVVDESGELRVREQGEYQGTSIDEYNQLLADSPTEDLQNRGINLPINEAGVPVPEPSGNLPIEKNESEQEVPLRAIGGQVPLNAKEMPENIERREEIPTGPVGEVIVEGKDKSGVADDIKTKSDGYVLSKGAVIANGKMYIIDLIDEAVQRLREKGIELDPNEVPESAEEIMVSNGEIIIPHILAEEIGYERLEKMNNRGGQITEELIAEKKQQQQQQQQPQQNMPGFNEGGMADQEQYAADMQEKVALRKEVMKDADEVIHIAQFPAESSKDMLYEYPRDAVKEGIVRAGEWYNQEPEAGFVGISPGIESSAFGKAQITEETIGDMLDRNLLGTGKLRDYAKKIQASQTLFYNYWVHNMKMGAADLDSGKEALKTLGINKNQFKKYIDQGYFTPSNQTNAKDEGIPRKILGKGSRQAYDFLFDAVLNMKMKRRDVVGIHTLIEKFHGAKEENQQDNVKYRERVMDFLGLPTK